MPGPPAPPDLSLVNVNPCPSPGLPPKRIELGDIPVGIDDPHYTRAVRVVNAYWSQAVNMTAVDQEEYYKLLLDKAFYIEPSAVGKPSNQRVTKGFKAQPSWGKYVFIRALYTKADQADQLAAGYFHSIAIEDLSTKYRQYCPKPVDVPVPPVVPLKRKKVTFADKQVDSPKPPPGPPPGVAPPAPPAPPVNKLSVNSVGRRLARLEELVAEHQEANVMRFDHVNDRLTLILREIIAMRQDINTCVQDVDALATKVNRLLAEELTEGSTED